MQHISAVQISHRQVGVENVKKNIKGEKGVSLE